jgi:hypothetical protein
MKHNFGVLYIQSNPLICIQQMSEHIIHLYGVFNNMINEIPTRGDNAGCSLLNNCFNLNFDWPKWKIHRVPSVFTLENLFIS